MVGRVEEMKAGRPLRARVHRCCIDGKSSLTREVLKALSSLGVFVIAIEVRHVLISFVRGVGAI